MKRFDPFAATFHFLHQNGKTGGYNQTNEVSKTKWQNMSRE